MVKILNHSILIIFISLTVGVHGQNEELKGYRIEGDEVVFIFDKRDYKEVNDNEGESLDFTDLNIYDVVLSGEFNDWSMNHWKMNRIDENIYELRKKTEDFTDEFAWEFKYVINNEYWAEPSYEELNAVRVRKKGYKQHVYNLKMFTAYSDENGNAKFKLKGYPHAKKVVLSGTFNRWDENVFKMKKTNDGWELNLQLRPGKYQYKFIIDGNWIEDVENEEKVLNEFDEYNSVVDIRVPIMFTLNGYLNAKEVILSGSFINWSEHKFPMKKSAIGWSTTIFLSGGKHHYKFIVDKEWIVDPENEVKEYDEEGNINSVRMVK